MFLLSYFLYISYKKGLMLGARYGQVVLFFKIYLQITMKTNFGIALGTLHNAMWRQRSSGQRLGKLGKLALVAVTVSVGQGNSRAVLTELVAALISDLHIPTFSGDFYLLSLLLISGEYNYVNSTRISKLRE